MPYVSCILEMEILHQLWAILFLTFLLVCDQNAWHNQSVQASTAILIYTMSLGLGQREEPQGD